MLPIENEYHTPAGDCRTRTSNRENRGAIAHQLNNQKLSCGFHREQLNTLPSNWYSPHSFPKIHFFNIWLQGETHQNIPPLRLIKSSNLLHFKCEKNKLSIMW